MDKILITYRGGYGDIYSVLTYLKELPKNAKITLLVEREHSFLGNVFKDHNLILNPLYKIIDGSVKDFTAAIAMHLKIKEEVEGFSQEIYDDSVVEVAFYLPSLYRPYYEFYKKLIDQHDLIITNYLDLTCVNVCLNSNKEWWQIRSWHKWKEEPQHLNFLNLRSPYKNIYYYERDWIKGYETDPTGDYSYRDSDFFYNFSYKNDPKRLSINVESFNLESKLRKHEKVFFASLGSMSKYNLKIGSGIKNKFILELERLFEEGWVGVAMRNEYDSFLKNIKGERFIHLASEWYPHEVIYKNVSLVLTHCGAGTFSRIVNSGMKAYVFPFQLDQFYFGDIIEKHYGGKMFL